MNDVIALHRCRKCRGPSVPLDVHEGEQYASTWRRLCEPCLGAAMAAFDEEQRLFEMLLSAGVSRDVANVMMVAKIEAGAA